MYSKDIGLFQTQASSLLKDIENEAKDLGIKLLPIYDIKGHGLILSKRLGMTYQQFISPTGQAFIAKHNHLMFDVVNPTLEELHQINPKIPIHAMKTKTLLESLFRALPEYQTEIEAFLPSIKQRIQCIMVRKLNLSIASRNPSLTFSSEDEGIITLDWGNIPSFHCHEKAKEIALLAEEICSSILPYLNSQEFYLRLAHSFSPYEGICTF